MPTSLVNKNTGAGGDRGGHHISSKGGLAGRIVHQLTVVAAVDKAGKPPAMRDPRQSRLSPASPSPHTTAFAFGQASSQ